MTTINKIEEDLKRALIERSPIWISALRLLRAALINAEIELRPQKQEMTEEKVIEVIQREIKKRKDSIEVFSQGGRQDLVEKEKGELEVLSSYLPEQFSDDKIREVVRAKITEINAVGPQDFGRVMGLVMKEVKGRAEGSRIQEVVKEELQNKQ